MLNKKWNFKKRVGTVATATQNKYRDKKTLKKD